MRCSDHGIICALSEPRVNLPALKLALTLVARRVRGEKGPSQYEITAVAAARVARSGGDPAVDDFSVCDSGSELPSSLRGISLPRPCLRRSPTRLEPAPGGLQAPRLLPRPPGLGPIGLQPNRSLTLFFLQGGTRRPAPRK